MNDLELILAIINELDSINVPVVLMQQIGVPLFNATGKLKAIKRAIEMNRAKDEQKKKENHEKEEG